MNEPPAGTAALTNTLPFCWAVATTMLDGGHAGQADRLRGRARGDGDDAAAAELGLAVYLQGGAVRAVAPERGSGLALADRRRRRWRSPRRRRQSRCRRLPVDADPGRAAVMSVDAGAATAGQSLHSGSGAAAIDAGRAAEPVGSRSSLALAVDTGAVSGRVAVHGRAGACGLAFHSNAGRAGVLSEHTRAGDGRALDSLESAKSRDPGRAALRPNPEFALLRRSDGAPGRGRRLVHAFRRTMREQIVRDLSGYDSSGRAKCASRAPVTPFSGGLERASADEGLRTKVRRPLAEPCGIWLRQAGCPRQELNLCTRFRKPRCILPICRGTSAGRGPRAPVLAPVSGDAARHSP